MGIVGLGGSSSGDGLIGDIPLVPPAYGDFRDEPARAHLWGAMVAVSSMFSCVICSWTVYRYIGMKLLHEKVSTSSKSHSRDNTNKRKFLIYLEIGHSQLGSEYTPERIGARCRMWHHSRPHSKVILEPS